MSDKLRLSISAVPDGFYRGGSVPDFEVCVGVAAADGEVFTSNVFAWLSAFQGFHQKRAESQNVKAIPKKYRFRLTEWDNERGVFQEKQEKVLPACCSEEEVLYSLLYACLFSKKEVIFQEINYKGYRCTEITDIDCFTHGYQFKGREPREPYDEVRSFPIRLKAVLNGSAEGVLYFFGPYIGFQGEGNRGNVDSYPLSNGIFIWDNPGEDFYYANMSPIVKHMEAVVDGTLRWVRIKEMAHVFCHMQRARDTVEVTFSVLLDGRLYRKISKDGDRAVFYCTPFYQNLDCTLKKFDGFEHGRSFYDVVFERADGGEYRYTAENQQLSESRFRGVTFTPPRELYASLPTGIAGGDGVAILDASKEALVRLFKSYVDTVYASFFAADEFHTGNARFLHIKGTENLFYAEAGGFGLILMPVKALYSSDFVVPESWGSFERDDFGDLFGIMKAYFVVDDVTVSLIPKDNSELEIEVAYPDSEGREGEKKIRGKFSELEKMGFFSGAELPETLRFDGILTFFLKYIQFYIAIKNVIEADPHKFIRTLGEIKEGISLEDLEKRLYGEDEVSDKEFIAFAAELQSKYKRTQKIPNIALFGEAGTGKSTRAKRLAEVVFHKEIMEATPSSLKPPFLGWAGPQIHAVILEASKKNQIVFIDEAYELMSDGFGREAVSILLPLMEGRLPADYTAEAGGNKAEVKWSDIKEIPPIWIAGYEDKTRLMLKENTGLYRRLEACMLTPPVTSDLYRELIKLIEKALAAIADGRDSELFKFDGATDSQISQMERKFNVLWKHFTDNEKLLKNYFQWGAQPQNSNYFAHHAGVRQFIDKCIGRIDFSKEITPQIEQVIRLMKREINHQVDTVRRNAEGGINVLEKVEVIAENATRFKDLVGCDTQIAYMNSILDMIVDKRRYEKNGVTVPKGALLLGAPGVGKTFIARAMAGELQERFAASDERVGFIALSASALTSGRESLIASLFDKVEEMFDACIIFIDEVDSIAKDRSANQYASHFLELLKQMDGIEQRSKIFILAATNAGESLDPAFTRPGRIDRKMEFYLPDFNARREMARRNIEKRSGLLEMFVYKENEEDVNGLAKEVAARTPGYTPGAIENIVNIAFMLHGQEKRAKKDAQEQVQNPRLFESTGPKEPGAGKTEHSELKILRGQLYEAIERHEMGDLRPVKEDEVFSVAQNDESRSSTAIHEVGHALVSILLDISFEKITSLPRGNALGYVSPDREAGMMTKKDFEERIRISMGGRAAEEIVYGRDKVSGGASQDMRNATYWARQMTERLGFTEEFGFMALKKDTARHLGQSAYTCSEAFREQSDRIVNELLKKQYLKTMTMLEDKRELIIKLAEKVFHEKTMTGEEFKSFYEGLIGSKAPAGSEKPAAGEKTAANEKQTVNDESV